MCHLHLETALFIFLRFYNFHFFLALSQWLELQVFEEERRETVDILALFLGKSHFYEVQ